MKIHCLQHIAFETPGSILEWARKSRHTVRITRLDLGETLPAVSDFDWLIIMGGPMNVYEENTYPWLHEEKALIREAPETEKPSSASAGRPASCSGSGRKSNLRKRKRNRLASRTYDRQSTVTSPLFLPAPRSGSLPVARGYLQHTAGGSPAYSGRNPMPEPGFMIENRIFGFQFHMENTPTVLSDLVRECGNELQDAPHIQKPEDILGHPEHIQENNRWIHLFLSRLEQQKKDLLSL